MGRIMFRHKLEAPPSLQLHTSFRLSLVKRFSAANERSQWVGNVSDQRLYKDLQYFSPDCPLHCVLCCFEEAKRES